MRKFICVFLAVLMLFATVACSKDDAKNSSSEDSAIESVDEKESTADSQSVESVDDKGDSSDDQSAQSVDDKGDSSDDQSDQSSEEEDEIVPDYDNLSFEPVEKTEECTPLLYKVTDDKGAVLYLLGSIHVGDERTQAMPDYVMDAYNSSDYICVEANIVAYEEDFEKLMSLAMKMMCKKGTTIKDYLSPDVYESTKKLLKSTGMYNAAYEMYGPAMWSSMVDEALMTYTELESDYGVDRYFINKANEDGKDVVEVESVEFQYDMMLGFSNDIYNMVMAESLYNPEEYVNSVNHMYETWLRGNEADIEEMLKIDYTGLSEEETKLAMEYNNKMLTERNIGMADKAEEYMADGGTIFYIVGTAHVAGDGALEELLRERGYKVEVVK